MPESKPTTPTDTKKLLEVSVSFLEEPLLALGPKPLVEMTEEELRLWVVERGNH